MSTQTVTLTAKLSGRTHVTEHATIDEAMSRVADIAIAQRVKIEKNDLAGEFVGCGKSWVVMNPEHHVCHRAMAGYPEGQVIGSYEISA